MTYQFTLPDNSVSAHEGLTEAREAAQIATDIYHAEFQVIHAESGIVAWVTTPVPSGRHFKPYERIENPKHPAPHYPGWIPAYTRKRVQGTAYRCLTRGGGWRMHDGRTGNYVDVANTKEGAHVFTEMRLGRLL